MTTRPLWLAFTIVIIGSFSVLGYYGVVIYREAPPIQDMVVTTDGRVVFTGEEIRDGQNVWQSMGGQEVGSIWGHGAYVAPDWSADWLHREAVWLLENWAQDEHQGDYASLHEEVQASLRQRLKTELRTNTYDPQTGNLIVSAQRAEAIRDVGSHYAKLFGDHGLLEELGEAYAIAPNALKTSASMSYGAIWWPS